MMQGLEGSAQLKQSTRSPYSTMSNFLAMVVSPRTLGIDLFRIRVKRLMLLPTSKCALRIGVSSVDDLSPLSRYESWADVGEV